MIGNAKSIIEWLYDQDREKIFEVKEKKQKRSLDSNSYLWVLITNIAEVVRASKEEIYIQELEKYGQSLLIPVLKGEKPNGYFKYYKYHSTRYINDKEVDYYIVFKGSSEMDQREMSILIDGVVSDCKELGIPTLEDKRLEEMIKNWGV